MRNSFNMKMMFLIALAITMNTDMAFSVDLSSVAKFFPQATGTLHLDRKIVVAMPNGKRQKLTSVMFNGPIGSAGGRTTTWCGLVFENEGEADQGVVAVGQGFTEAISCDGLAEAAAMPRAHGALRIGLRYQANSPNASSVEPVVVTRDKTGKWHVDDEIAERLANMPEEVTLQRMKKILSNNQ